MREENGNNYCKLKGHNEIDVELLINKEIFSNDEIEKIKYYMKARVLKCTRGEISSIVVNKTGSRIYGIKRIEESFMLFVPDDVAYEEIKNLKNSNFIKKKGVRYSIETVVKTVDIGKEAPIDKDMILEELQDKIKFDTDYRPSAFRKEKSNVNKLYKKEVSNVNKQYKDEVILVSKGSLEKLMTIAEIMEESEFRVISISKPGKHKKVIQDFYIPKQVVSKSSVKYEGKDMGYDYIDLYENKGYYILGYAHGHGSLEPSHSSIDNAGFDEKLECSSTHNETNEYLFFDFGPPPPPNPPFFKRMIGFFLKMVVGKKGNSLL